MPIYYGDKKLFDNSSTDTRMTNMESSLNNVLSQLAQRKVVIPLPDVSIPASSLLTGAVMEKSFDLSCAGLLTTDRIEVVPKSMPTNYGLRGYSVTVSNILTLKVQCPVLLSGGSPVVFSVTAFR